ncbi:MAG: hypothetical protein WBZ29_14820 [Methanocella sp.]
MKTSRISPATSGLIVLAIVSITVLVAGCDDPYEPRPPSYQYTVNVEGLENFVTDNGTATIMVPVPAYNGTSLIRQGWVPRDIESWSEVRHGTEYAEPVITSYGPMLAIRVNMTDYYISYARATPIAVQPGASGPLPTIVPEQINKSRTFEDIHVSSSQYMISELNYPTSTRGRDAVIDFLKSPLQPAFDISPDNFSSYIYIDPSLRPLVNGSLINISITLEISLNHNKVNKAEEGARSFEYHTFTVAESLPAGTSGFIPVVVKYAGPASRPI